MDIRDNVKRLCKLHGITQKEVATKMGITDNSLNITLNKANPKLSTLESIAKAMGVPVIDLLRDPAEVEAEYHAAPKVEYVPYLRCPHCGKEIELFARPIGLERTAE